MDLFLWVIGIVVWVGALMVVVGGFAFRFGWGRLGVRTLRFFDRMFWVGQAIVIVSVVVGLWTLFMRSF